MPICWRRKLLGLMGLALAHGGWVHGAWAQAGGAQAGGAQAGGAREGWMLFSREGECIDLAMLARREQLPRVPSSPEDFAAMLRPRYPGLSIGLPDGFPPEMQGKVVMVRWADNRAPIFVRAEMCRAAGAR